MVSYVVSSGSEQDEESDFVGSADEAYESDHFVKEPTTKRAKKTVNTKSREVIAVDFDENYPNLVNSTANAANDSNKRVEEIYQKKTQLEHILLRPDTYIGSIEHHNQQMYVYDRTTKKIILKNISFVPGLFKIFDEILVNAADNKIRDPSMSCVKVEIDRQENRISIYNDGKGIPIQIHQKEKVYVPELIFGHLLTSSNYNDDDKKVTGGRNGYGAKLCNIFSKKFIVETADKEQRKCFIQTFTNNMSVKSTPSISRYDKRDFTRITFYPDLDKFKMQELDDDILSVFEKRVYDLAGCVRNIKVFLNEELLPVRSFKDYVALYSPTQQESDEANPASNQEVFIDQPDDRWTIGLSVSKDGQFQQMSFVNSICTYKGGTHVNYIVDQVIEKLVEVIKKKKKDATIKNFQIKNHLAVFINCHIENPSFDSQTKEFMTLKPSAFGSKCILKPEFIKKFIAKSTIAEELLNFENEKANKAMKKNDGHKNTRISGIPKLDDANYAGTRQAHKCTLILTEGDSAKALAVAGLSVVGRDFYGVFPLRGKLLNVRDATSKQVTDNQEITQIKQIMGLQHGKTYDNVDSLRYGHLMIMTDQDHDGSHIKGLVINFVEHFWPSLLQIPGFLLEFITPIVKCTKGNREIAFYTMPEYEKWKVENSNGKGWNIKYFKGLGTSTAQDAKAYFKAIDKHLKEFEVASTDDKSLIDMVFAKKKSNERKDWLKDNYSEDSYIDHAGKRTISLAEFVNKELVLFSMADNVRSIPCVLDGLKPGQRKILYCCFKRNLKNEIKLAQLAGYVSEHAAYHHGEQSLHSTMIGMAQDFVGSNNINLLLPNGQFGTRLQGGKDAASPRYIFTSLNPITKFIFKEEDFSLLKYLNDDGIQIEPEWYLPIIPMVLVNGCEGIGTGWSTSIPNFNPLDVIFNLKAILSDSPLKEMHPWYKNFHGTIEHLGDGKYKISGKIRKIDHVTLEVTELPIGMWTQTFKEMLEEMMNSQTPLVRQYREYHTETTVKFIITLSNEEAMSSCEASGLDKTFKLSSQRSTSNLVCFSSLGALKKYENVIEILHEFYGIRLNFYHLRKEHLISLCTEQWKILDSKVKFIRDIVSGKLKINNRKKQDIIKDLISLSYSSLKTNSTENEGETEESNFNYLLSMPLWSLTMEKIQELEGEKGKKEAELKILSEKTPKQMWIEDLNDLSREWEKEESGNTPSFITQSPSEVKKSTKRQPKKPKVQSSIEFDSNNILDLENEKTNSTISVTSKQPILSFSSSTSKNTIQIIDSDEELFIPLSMSQSKEYKGIKKQTNPKQQKKSNSADKSTALLARIDAVLKADDTTERDTKLTHFFPPSN